MDSGRPLLSLVIEPKTRADEAKLKVGLDKLMADDSTMRVRTGDLPSQVVIAGIGELHLEIIIDRLKREFNVEASVGKPQVAYKETFTQQADGEGRFVRQTGARGYYAHVKIRVRPGARETGYVFQSENVDVSIPKEYVPSIDEGIKEALARGVLAGYPIDDVKVELYDGSYHEVDSSPMAFRIAAAMALQDASKKASPVLLEPLMRVELNVPVEYVGDVIADLAERRGQIQSGTDVGDMKILRAIVPCSEMFGYRTDLHTRTRGRATYSMTFERYEEHPGDSGDDDWELPVGAPRKPLPKLNDSAIALPESDDGDT